MSTPDSVNRITSASATDVWSVLADGWTYASWVVGTSRIRAVEPGWPAAGTHVHHSFGIWPVVVSDSTASEEAEPSRHLVLTANGGPLGRARVEITLTPTLDGGCELSIREDAIDGPGRWLVITPLRRQLIRVRNTETLRRLAFMAERRTQPDSATSHTQEKNA